MLRDENIKVAYSLPHDVITLMFSTLNKWRN